MLAKPTAILPCAGEDWRTSGKGRRAERRAARISCTGGRRRRGRGTLSSPSDRTRASRAKVAPLRTRRRCQMKIITLKSQCFSRKKIGLMGFARNERIRPFDKKPVGISVAYIGVRMQITPRIANPSRTRMPMRVSNHVCDGNASA